ncbi:uncharacterized protein LOC122093099 [Macadamia integrifolia]|uniref:uncharacterized protein LOC122093099 n=1 Tax=Macadamia integrifolia TaxID=60698 RepID=UPI001C52A899|nr:uncharacterized protein LOC122093099 [Macadamia integrifolia]
MDVNDHDQESSLSAMEDFFCYHFKDKTLLQKALTHSSYAGSSLSYERLEFLGDAALGLAVAEYGFQTYPELKPGQLTLLRAANIDTENLARVAVRHDLYRFVRRKTPSLDARVKKFTQAVQEEDDAGTYCGSVKAPKVLADIVESIAAAVYIDCNRDIQALWEVFKNVMEPLVTLETLHKHLPPTKILYEFWQKQGKKVEIKDYWEGSENFANVYVDGKLMGSASAEQTKIARFKAASEALQNLLLKSDDSETDEDGDGDEEIKGAKSKLNDLYIKDKEKWRQPKYKIEQEIGPPHEKKYICSVELKTVDGDTHSKTGEIRSRVKDAENSAAYMMLQDFCISTLSPARLLQLTRAVAVSGTGDGTVTVTVTGTERLLMKLKMNLLKEEYEFLTLSYTMDGFDRMDYSSPSSLSSMATAAVDMNMREAVAAVESLLCYRFRDKTLLQEALTHSSYTESPSYQRLEFVGDAALGLALAEYVFRAYPGLDPGQLSLLRAANISTENLARVAVRHELYRYVRHNAPSLDAKVSEFVLAVQEEDGAVTYCGSVKAPKILADIVESVAAAVYVDCNYDLKALWEVFKSLMEPIVTLETLHKQPQPVTMLFEFCQKQGKQVDIKHWRKESKNVASVYVDGKLIGSGSSEQKDIAKLNAAKEALEKLWKSEPSEMETEGVNGAEEIEGAKHKLNELCGKKKWRQAKYRVEREVGLPHERKFICSVQVETVDGTYFTTGDIRSRVKDAENSAASMMLQGLKDSENCVGLVV